MAKVSAPPSTFYLRQPVDATALSTLRLRAGGAARSGIERVVVDIDAIPALDTRVISCLIATLREVREAGGQLVLAVAAPSLLETLSVTGLDKVFTLQAPVPEPLDHLDPPAPPPAPKPRSRKARLATAGLLALALVLGLSRSGGAEEQLQPQTIVDRVIAANPSLRSYEARVHVAIHMQSFPFLAPSLSGTTYFKRPDNYEVVLDRVPSYARGFDRLYADIGDPTDWSRRFNMTVVGERAVDDHTDVVLRLVQKVRGMIDHQDVAVDESAWRIDQMEWHYYNGGVITMTQGFEHQGEWNVLSSQHAVIRIPYVHAVADASYDDYRTNVAVADDVFTKKAK